MWKVSFIVAWILGLIATSGASGAERHAFFWTGLVTGKHELILRRDMVRIEDLSGPPVEKQVYRFVRPLPDDAVKMQLDLASSRGYVHVIDEPSMSNDYTARIQIDDRQTGPYWYSLGIDWVAEGSPSLGEAAQGHATAKDRLWSSEGKRERISRRAQWTGAIDGALRLHFHDGQATTDAGKMAGRMFQMQGTSWPQRAYHPIVLATAAGTRASVIALPSPRNGNSLVVDLYGTSAAAVLEIAW